MFHYVSRGKSQKKKMRISLIPCRVNEATRLLPRLLALRNLHCELTIMHGEVVYDAEHP